MSTISICRICLASNVNMYHMKNSAVQDVFEKLTCKKLTDNGRPETICYICYAWLQKCNKLLDMYKKTENVFAQLSNGGIEITHDAISFLKRSTVSDLSTTPVSHLVIQPLKDLGDITDDYQNVIVKVEQVKSEPVECNECDVLEEVVYDYDCVDSYDCTDFSTWHDGIILEQMKFEPDDNDNANRSNKKQKQDKIPHTSVETIYTCLICSEIFEEKHELKQHLRLHNREKLYSCDECNEIFTIQSNLQRHIEDIHSKLELYSCEQCDKTFKRSEDLQGHMRTHTGLKSYTCRICKMSFSQRSSLKQHVIDIHSNERPYFCGICHKTFKRKCNWQEHDRIHNEEKPYSCHECDFKCTHLNTLRAHATKAHLV